MTRLTLIPTLTLLAFALALASSLLAQDKKAPAPASPVSPAPLSTDEKLKLSAAALELSTLENEYRRIVDALTQTRTKIEAADRSYRELNASLSKSHSAPGCTVNIKTFEWDCPKPVTETKATQEKK